MKERIKELRLLRGLSQEELAMLVGLKSRASINKIELGKCDISMSKINKFAKALRTSPEYLFDGSIDIADLKNLVARINKLNSKNFDITLQWIDNALLLQESAEKRE